jgi:capsular polysaccharide biosynthesis protein
MSQQALDLRRSIQIARRHKRLLGVTVILGLLLGAAYAVLDPPKLTSTALVLLPQTLVQSGNSASSATVGSGTDIDTQVIIAGSDTVLAGALPHVQPAMSLLALESRVQVQNVAGSILSISVSGGTAEQAEATANAVAASYIAYVDSPNSPTGQVAAKILESATAATGTKLPEQIGIFGLLGALAGAIVGFVIALGVPVLASIPVSHPSDAASWAKLFEDYDPGVIPAWNLGKLLRQFEVTGQEASGRPRAKGFSVTVLSFSTDPGALSLGPQLAAYAAAQGIPTVLVIGPQQDESFTATLRIACAEPLQSAIGSRKPLRLLASDVGIGQMPSAFVIVVTVVDPQAPRLPEAGRTSATVLGVSSGATTAEQLARVATASANAGHEVVGILVADPDPSDQTSGRIPGLAPTVRRSQPTRVKDTPTEIRR